MPQLSDDATWPLVPSPIVIDIDDLEAARNFIYDLTNALVGSRGLGIVSIDLNVIHSASAIKAHKALQLVQDLYDGFCKTESIARELCSMVHPIFPPLAEQLRAMKSELDKLYPLRNSIVRSNG